MVRLFIRHQVREYPTWRKAYDAFDGERQSMGVRGHAVFQTIDAPNDVTVWHDFEDVATAKAFTSSERLRDVMSAAGVQGEPQLWFVTED
jgi:hypothetical protein